MRNSIAMAYRISFTRAAAGQFRRLVLQGSMTPADLAALQPLELDPQRAGLDLGSGWTFYWRVERLPLVLNLVATYRIDVARRHVVITQISMWDDPDDED